MAQTGRPRGRLYSVRRSPLHGKGAFALQRIPKGTKIGEYVGEKIDDEEADRRYPEEGPGPHHTFLFALDDGSILDAAVGGNSTRFLNHSCDPNCEAVEEDGRIFLYTVRAVRTGYGSAASSAILVAAGLLLMLGGAVMLAVPRLTDRRR